MAFERVDMPVPQVAEWLQPLVHFLKGFRFQTIEPTLGVNSGIDKPRLAKHLQVLRYGRLRQLQALLNVTNGSFGIC